MASLGVQVHGGMGFIEETGAAQHYRDIRIAAIYEGTNGIQAIDLVTRKIGLGNGVIKREIADMRATIEKVRATNAPDFGQMATRLAEAVDSFETATQYMTQTLAKAPNDALAGATPYLRLFALARGGTALANLALAARPAGALQAHQVSIARFFADNLCTGAKGLEVTVTEGAASVHMAQTALADI